MKKSGVVLILAAFGMCCLAAGQDTVTLSPNVLNLVVGETHSIQALNPAGQPVPGLTWTSSDPTVVSLSTDDPPVLSALAAGHVTITAGTATADVTVSAGALPVGTVIWSSPGNGSGVTSIVPAVPSPSGVADVFAFQGDGTVQAITSDGTTAWTADVSQAVNISSGKVVPDFQGGLVVWLPEWSDSTWTGSVTRLDGMTGQQLWTYTPPDSTYLNWLPSWYQSPVAVHPDGTIFTVQYQQDVSHSEVVGIDPATGAQKFSVPLLDPSEFYTSGDTELGCGQTFDAGFNLLGLMIAGDGYAYVPYVYTERYYDCDSYGYPPYATHLRLLRVSSSGAYDQINVRDWPATPDNVYWIYRVGMTTNADTGILLTWELDPEAAWDWVPDSATTEFDMAITTGTGVSLLGAPGISNQAAPISGILQAQDGSFVGAVGIGPEPGDVTQYDMVAFDQGGSLLWSVPNEQPQIATDDGGVIGQSGIIYDQSGTATGSINLATQSWTAGVYTLANGSVSAVVQPPAQWASSFGAAAGGNPSGSFTAVPFLSWLEASPIWGLGRGPNCQVGDNKASLGGLARQQYDNLKLALLAGNYLTCVTCATFFNASETLESYFSQLTAAVSRQVPYDGNQTTISMYDAGLWTANDTTKPTFPVQWTKTPVCADFSQNSGYVAEAQTQPPATDVYVNTNPKIFKKYLQQNTILHECLHNLTRLGDGMLEILLGLPDTTADGKGTVVINKTLENHGCAAITNP